MKLAVIHGNMNLIENFKFTEEEFFTGRYLDKLKPTLRINVDYENIKSEDKDDGEREYFVTEDYDYIYKEYEMGLDEICMYHPAYLSCEAHKVSGLVYVKEDEVEKGKQILLDAFKKGLNKEMKKINILMKAVEEKEKEQ